MAPSGVNDTIREIMAQVKRWQNRTSGRRDAGTLVSGDLGASVTVSTSYDVAPASLYTGFEFSFKAGANCPADALIAINGLGNKNLQKVTPAGYVNVEVNDYLANQHVKGKYDATLDKCILLSPLPTSGIRAASDTAAGPIEIAIQSEQEAGTDTTRAVTPGRQHFHKSAAKFWATWVSNASVDDSYNVSSVTDTGTGDWTVNIGTDFSGTDYGFFTDINRTVATYHSGGAQAAGTLQVLTFNAAASAVDPGAGLNATAGGFGDI
jgi:hypothetical protein